MNESYMIITIEKLRAENAKLRDVLEKIAEPISHDCQAMARAAIRAMQNIPQSSSPAQSDGSSGSHNAHVPDVPDS